MSTYAPCIIAQVDLLNKNVVVGTSDDARLSALLQPIRELQGEHTKLLGMCTDVVEL